MISRKELLIATLIFISIVDVVLYAAVALQPGNVVSLPTGNGFLEEQSTIGDEPLAPLPKKVIVDPALAELGKRLFHDPRLSGDDSVACASCHSLATAGMDGKSVSTGIHAQNGTINAPSVFNSVFNTRQFWDGRAETLEEQAKFPITNPREMGSNWNQVIPKLQADPNYPGQFAKLFTDGITPDNVARAIAEFERTLITPNSRFDRFLLGDKSAITSEERQGYSLFKSYGCASCHQGAAVGGNMFERLGAVRDYFADHGPEQPEDLGRFNVTKNEVHRHYFKVPSLRNVEKTAPYFHNGKALTLHHAIKDMGIYNLGVNLPAQDIELLAKFLRTLTGEYEGTPL